MIAGCADHDAESGTGATASIQSSGADVASTSGATDADANTDTGATSTTGAVTATTGADTGSSTTVPTTGDGGSSESGGETTGADETTGTTGGTTGAASDGTSGGETADTLSFAADVYPIFDANCSCHEDDNGAGKLRLRIDDAYLNLVDKPADQLPEMMLVAPGATKVSYLWHKLNNTQKAVGGSGKKMPSGGLLEPEELAVIQTWIDEGAHP